MVSHNNLIKSHYEAVAQICCKKELFSKTSQNLSHGKAKVNAKPNSIHGLGLYSVWPERYYIHEIIFDTKYQQIYQMAP